MGYSREQIKNAVEWDGSSAIDGTDPDWYFNILEQADPKVLASVRAEVARGYEYRESIARASTKTPVTKKPSRKELEASERRYRRSLPFHFIQD